MLFMIVNAVVMAVLLVLVVVPSLFIYDPSKHPGESHGPPPAGEVISGDNVSHSVRQKLYMLFMIPACVVANALFLYFSYYRIVRYVQYRVEVNIMSLFEMRAAAHMKLRYAGYQGIPPTSSTINFANPAFIRNEQSTTKAMSASGWNDGAAAVVAAHATVDWDRGDHFSRRARPKAVEKDRYVHSTFYPEVKRLMDVIERRFFTPATITEKNFQSAVMQIIGESPPGFDDPFMPLANAPMSSAMPTGFYSSKKNVQLDSREHIEMARGPAYGHRRHSGVDAEAVGSTMSRCNTSVVLVLSDSKAGGRSPQHKAGAAPLPQWLPGRRTSGPGGAGGREPAQEDDVVTVDVPGDDRVNSPDSVVEGGDGGQGEHQKKRGLPRGRFWHRDSI